MEDRKNGLLFDLGAFDLDGTVLKRDLTITEATTEAFRKMRERGMRLVVATGRRYEGAREHAQKLGFEGTDPIVCYGGSMIRRMDGETLLKRHMEIGPAVEVLEWAEKRGIHARIFLDGKIVTSRNTPAVSAHSILLRERNLFTVESPARWLETSGEEPIKVTLVDFPNEVEAWLDEVREAFSERLFVTRSLPHYVEIGSPEGKKSGALGFLCERWGIDPARAIAFGDADNDVDMLLFAGHGVAVGDGVKAVCDAADAITGSVDEDGVASYVVEKILGGK